MFFKDSNRTGVKYFYGRIDTTTGGALASTTSMPGCTITKVAGKTGRYRIALNDKRFREFLGLNVTLGGLTDAATSVNCASTWKVRNVNIPASGMYVEVQGVYGTVDGEPDNGVSIWLELIVRDSSAKL